MKDVTFYKTEKKLVVNMREGSKRLLKKILSILKSEGFQVEETQNEKYHSEDLFENKYLLSNKELNLFLNHSNNSIELYFTNGAEEIFDKHIIYRELSLDDMPYLNRLKANKTRNKVIEMIEEEGILERNKTTFDTAYDEVMYHIKDSWHYKEGSEKDGYNMQMKDRDGKSLINGETKYFYGRDNRLKRGKVYANLNGMVWVITGEKEYTNVLSRELFDVSEWSKVVRRHKQHEMPQYVRIDKLRKKFNTSLSYQIIDEMKLYRLKWLIAEELSNHDGKINMRLSTNKKKDVKILKRTGLKFAMLKVDGSYFKEREAISFNESGFIGFAGWASGYNLEPFANAFEKWMDEMLVQTNLRKEA